MLVRCVLLALAVAVLITPTPALDSSNGGVVANSTGYPVDRFVVSDNTAYMMRTDKPSSDGVVAVNLATGSTTAVNCADVSGGIAINAFGDDKGLFVSDKYGWIRKYKYSTSKDWKYTNFYRFDGKTVSALSASTITQNPPYSVFALVENTVYGIKSDGSPFTLNSTGFAQVSDIAVDQTGQRVYVLDQLQVSVIDLNTNAVSFFAPNSNDIQGTRLVAGGEGLFVMSGVSSAVYYIPFSAPSTSQIAVPSGATSKATDIALLNTNQVVIASQQGANNAVWRYNFSVQANPSPTVKPSPTPAMSPGLSPTPSASPSHNNHTNGTSSPSPGVSPSSSPTQSASPTPKPGFNHNVVLTFFNDHPWALYSLMGLCVVLLFTTLGCWICACRHRSSYPDEEDGLLQNRYR